MVQKKYKEEPVVTDRKDFAAYDASDEFDDERTAPVPRGSAAEGHSGYDCRENLFTAPVHSLSTGPVQDEPLEPGFVLHDRFEIVCLAHTGGMSHVYKAIDRRLHRRESEQSYVAIKMLRPLAVPEQDEAATLEREAASAQRLSHPNIVNIYDFEMYGGQFYLVMEWLEGESVKDRLQRTSGRLLAADFSWHIIHGVASALEHAHANNVVHADINLSNVLITDTQQIKLLDFGVARFSTGEEDVSSDEPIWVTHKYASPEVLSGSTPVFTDDIFSLGCVAYRLLSGRHAFARTSSLEAKESGLTVQPIAGLSVRRWQIISQTLAFSRSDRPGTASVFLDRQPAWTGEAMRRIPESMHRVRETMRRVPKGMHRVWETIRRIPESMHGVSETMHRVQAVARTPWLFAIPVAAVVLAVGLWSLLRTGAPDEPTAEQQPAVEAEPQITDTPRPVPALDEFLGRAAHAMASERYVLPADDSARFFYNEVLAIDPDNPTAVAGLREISDIYLQQASSALNAEKLSEAAAALAIAAETSPDNPAIKIVNDLLVARVDTTIANARQAAVEGDLPQAAALLAEIERNPLVDRQELGEIRLLVAKSSEEQQLAEAIARAEEHIAARRLTVPDENNAHALLLELRDKHAGDDRLRATTDSLGDQLLAEAVIASAAGEKARAGRLLGAAESLGVNPDEIEQTRRILTADAERSPDTQVAAATPGASPGQQATTTGVASEMPQLPAEALIASAATETAQLPAGAAVMPEASAGSDTPATDEAAEREYVSLETLQIEKYVAPFYPRSARRRGLTGNVEMRFRIFADGSTGDIEVVRSQPGDIFVSSAKKAVGKWRFAPSDETILAQVTVRFDEE